MPELRSKSLYAQLGIRDFATSTEIAKEVSQMGDVDSDERKAAAEILTDYKLKNAYDMVLEAWGNPDRMLPRFATQEAATIVIEVAKRAGFVLNEIHTNTYQVRTNSPPEKSDEQEPATDDQDLEIKVGSRQLIFATSKFIAHKERFKQRIVLETFSSESNSLQFIPDTIVQDETVQGDEGLLIQLKQGESQIEQVNFAILNQSQCLAAPLAEGGSYLFSKSNQSIAIGFQVRDSNERIRQLIRGYYRDLANLVTQLDSRIGRQAMLKSFMSYFERYYS